MQRMVKILKREPLAHGKIALHLERPEGFRFVSGHNIDVALENQREIDPADTSRTFSIASAPYEREILIAAILRDNPYKNALKSLPIGSNLIIDGPYGTFRMHHDQSQPAAFIVGGIGITPVLSMLRQAAQENLQYPIYVFYANRRFEDTAFYNELAGYAGKFRDYVFVPTFTRQHTSNIEWAGETGYIDRPMLERYIPDIATPQYYVVGPSAMVWGTLQMLDGFVDRASIKVEDFTGFD
jgi:ferredoxin-NADP reductase